METNEIIKILEAEIYKLYYETKVDEDELYEMQERIASLNYRISKLKAQRK